MAVFHCGMDIAWIYILAQLLASVLACSIFAFVSGWGPLMPLKSYKELNISWPEALHMWMTGQPPKRLQGSEDENIQDVMARVEKVTEDRENERLSHDPQYKKLAQKQEQLRASEQGGGDAAADV